MIVQGTVGAETLSGGASADTIIGGLGADTLTGGGGVDIFRFAPGDSTIAASDRITDFQADDRLDFGLPALSPNNGYAQTATSVSSAQTQAADAFAYNLALRYIAIEVDSDVLIFVSTIGGGQTASLVTLTGVNLGVLSYSSIIGGTSNNPAVVTGTDGPDSLNGGDAGDSIVGGGGNDTIAGGLGADVLTGGAGNDLFKVAVGDSPIAAADQITDFQSSDRLDFGFEAVTEFNAIVQTAASLSAAVSQANVAMLAYSTLRYVASQVGSNLHIFVSVAGGGQAQSMVTLVNPGPGLTLANIDGYTPVNPNLFTGTDGADSLVGTAFSDTILGGGGNDTIIGGAGADQLTGGAGADLFRFGWAVSTVAAPDRITDFQAEDRLDFGLAPASASNAVVQSATTLGAATAQADATFAANSALRYVATTVGGNVHVFASDADGGETLSMVTLVNPGPGLSLANIIGAPPNYNIIDGTNGRDTLVGGAGNDSLTGFADSDTLSGGAGNDTLLGGEGRDTLTGGLGNDRLSGGADEDRFVFGPGDSGQFFNGVITLGTADIVADFQTGIDVLTFGAGPAQSAAGGNYIELPTAFTTYASAETAAGTAFADQASLVYVVAQVGSDAYVFVDTGGPADADTLVYLQGVALSGIAAADIV